MAKLLFTILSVMFLSIKANAATLNLGTLTLSVTSTGITCPLPTNLVPPVAVNTTICTFTVTPSGWQGTLSNPTGGADSSKFAVVAVGGNSVLQNNVQLTATGSAAGNGNYAIGTVTSTP